MLALNKSKTKQIRDPLEPSKNIKKQVEKNEKDQRFINFLRIEELSVVEIKILTVQAVERDKVLGLKMVIKNLYINIFSIKGSKKLIIGEIQAKAQRKYNVFNFLKQDYY